MKIFMSDSALLRSKNPYSSLAGDKIICLLNLDSGQVRHKRAIGLVDYFYFPLLTSKTMEEEDHEWVTGSNFLSTKSDDQIPKVSSH